MISFTLSLCFYRMLQNEISTIRTWPVTSTHCDAYDTLCNNIHTEGNINIAGENNSEIYSQSQKVSPLILLSKETIH